MHYLGPAVYIFQVELFLGTSMFVHHEATEENLGLSSSFSRYHLYPIATFCRVCRPSSAGEGVTQFTRPYPLPRNSLSAKLTGACPKANQLLHIKGKQLLQTPNKPEKYFLSACHGVLSIFPKDVNNLDNGEMVFP